MNVLGWPQSRYRCLSGFLAAIALLHHGIKTASASPHVRTAETRPTLPSSRCELREEWQPTCLMWSGRPRERYLLAGKINPKDGVGASLRLIGSAIDMALSFDLELVLRGPFLAAHGVGDWGAWFGLVGDNTSPLLAVNNADRYLEATREDPNQTTNTVVDWLSSQENRTSVLYAPKMMEIGVIDWGAPAAPSPARYDDRVCGYARQVLRQLYWGRGEDRDRCRSFLGDASALGIRNGSNEAEPGHRPDGKGVQQAEGNSSSFSRPWTVGVHVRRGDVTNRKRIVPHSFFVEAVRAVLYGIAEVHKVSDETEAPSVTILVFSEGKKGMQGLQILDEDHKVVTWDIARDVCQELGLRCHQEILLETSLYDAFECLSAVDVIVGSMSTMSEVIAALSTNVKVIPTWPKVFPMGDKMQDRVGLDVFEVAEQGSVGPEKQEEIYRAISEWRGCFGEALQSNADGDPRGANATSFYHTVAV